LAARRSITIQIEPGLIGHAAVVVNEPDRHTYAGFGPKTHGAPWSYGRFDVHSVERGKEPPNDFSSAAGAGQYQTYTIPITEAQAQQALKEIERLRTTAGNYNAGIGNVCTTIVNRIMEAAGLGRNRVSAIRPSSFGDYLSNVENTLSANPHASVIVDQEGTTQLIPRALRDVQQDYSAVGTGYDTAAERLGRISGAQGGVPALPSQTLGGQRGAIEPNASPDSDQLGMGPDSSDRYLRGRLVDQSGRTVFETGALAVPFVRSGSLPAQAPDASQPLRSSSAGPMPAGAQYGGNNASLSGGSPGHAVPVYPAPPILGGPDASAPSDADMNDWFTRWVKPLMQN
jgi:hypothetical protein